MKYTASFLCPITGILWLFSLLAAGSDRPNVLWLISDDHAAYVTGCYGNQQVRTPNLDALAASGMRFDRAYCNAPVCTASRAAFITGMYPRSVGVTDLSTPLPKSAITLGDVLTESGYETIWFGKTHFNSQLKHGFNQLVGREDWSKWLISQGVTVDETSPDVLPVWKPFKDPARLWVNGVYRPYGLKDEYMWDTWFAKEAVKFIEQKRDKPWCCVVSLTVPHSPFRFPLEYRDRHDPPRFKVPQIGAEDEAQIPEVFRDLTPDEKRRVQASYYTSTEYMDKNMGLVLEALEESGQADNTIVVYIGDHGYMLGQHGRFEKHCSYEPAVRSPLMIRYPPEIRKGQSTRALVEFIDVMPTILEYCGIETPNTVQGRSLKPLLSEGKDQHRAQVFVEYAWADEVMVCDDRWKLVYIRGKDRRTDGYDPGPNYPLPGPTLKLYDLKNDPEEFTNLASRKEQASRVQELLQILVNHLKATARQPEKIPTSDDPMVILDYCSQSHDITHEEALR